MATSPTTGAYRGNGVAFMLTVGQDGSSRIEIDVDSDIWTVAFAANGEYIIGGGDGLGVWRVEDGTHMATLAAWNVRCLAVSKDGRWIAAGTHYGYAIVWDAKTFEKVFTYKEDFNDILGVDFSPDSTRLLVAAKNFFATVWDVTGATCRPVLVLPHLDLLVIAAKYSPQGDRIATATRDYARVYDSNDGSLLVQIHIKTIPLFNTGLLWSNNHLFAVSVSTIEQFEASPRLIVSGCPVGHSSNHLSCIALPQHGEFIAYSTNATVTFWDASTHSRLGLIRHTQFIRSIALSADDRFLVIGGKSGKIAIKDLRGVLPESYVAYLNSFTANLPDFGFSLWTRTPIALSLSHHSLTSPTLHSIPGSRTGSQTRKHR